MLEHPILWLGPWTLLSGSGAEAARLIGAGAADHRLGQAARRPRPAAWWRRWFTPAAIDVFEGEDDSLLLTMQRAWGVRPGWEVLDADGRHVGFVHNSYTLDPYGRPLALLVSGDERSQRSFVTADGRDLATLGTNGDSVLLSFASTYPENPFARMLLLAAALLA